MHNFILGLFKFIRSFWQFMKIVIVFCILMLLFFWVETLTSANWGWLDFIRPLLESLVKTGNLIFSGSLNLFGALFEFKFAIALIILVACFYIMNFFIMLTNIVEDIYDDGRRAYKKTEEKIMNKTLQDNVKREEKKISKYMVFIQTTLKKKFTHKELNINVDEQNRLMNEFLAEKIGTIAMNYDGGFLYQFNDFNQIDEVLDALFRVIHSNAPLDYAISIQAGENLTQLKKIASLKYFGKITMAADTAYRYKYNTSHRYGTSQIGIFQNGDTTLELHEFKEIL